MGMTVLIATHSPALPTGYGRVCREVAAALHAAGHAVTVVGGGDIGGGGAGPDPFPYRVIPSPQGTAAEPVARALVEHRPQVLLTIGDPWMFEFLPDLPQRAGATWVAYFPVDGYPMPRAWVTWVAAVDVPVVFCRFTQDLIARATGRTPRLIYHGVDTATFAPAVKPDARRRVGLPPDAFVVGTVAANQQRKNLPALVKAFAAFAADKPDAWLYLHTRIDGHWDIEELVERFGLTAHTRATLNLDPRRGLPDELLATVYNAFDVFALPTMAEGFGLPILESQSCGVPALATDFSACPELLPDPFQRLRVARTIVMARNFEQAVVDEDDLAAKLDHLYRHPADRATLAAAGRRFAQTFDWWGPRAQFAELIGAIDPRPS